MEPEVKCTAVEANPDERPNILMVPPCACPRCAPDPEDRTLEQNSDRWLRVSGSRQRLAVKPLDLGPTGRDLLG